MNFSKLKDTFIIAEVSANHGQNLLKAIKMIKAAKKCGVDAIKFQLYTPETLTIDAKTKYFKVKHPEWGRQTLYELYKKAYTPWEWFPKLKKVAEDSGLFFFSTAFDKSSVDFLEKLKVRCHKISSFELVDLPLIEYAASRKKPLIMSFGMATEKEVREAVKVAKKAGAKEIILLKCVSSYPARVKDMNLRVIPDAIKKFKCIVGLSDHTLSGEVAIAAVSLGAKIVEKHFTLSREDDTPDSFFSLEPRELEGLVKSIRTTEECLGRDKYGFTEGEKGSLKLKRSLFVVKDVRKGEVFTNNNVMSIRPGNGLSPKFLRSIIGKKAKKNIKKGNPLTGDLIEKFKRV